ncbi:MAG: thiamine biosynthesis protein ThiJ [Clostridia bacterium]|nr:thiamine biosynthesis protein ThiJ [Clostridia bacterium]
MNKILCYIYNDMADFEMVLACQMLRYLNKFELVPIAYEMAPVRSNPGLIYQPAATVKDALDFDDVEGLIIPGGWNDEQREELTQLIQKLHGEGKLLASICAGPQYLSKAGILETHKFTTTLTKEYIESQGREDFFPRRNYIMQNVVRDGSVITAVGNAFVDFAVEIADWFGMYKDQAEKEEYLKHFKAL